MLPPVSRSMILGALLVSIALNAGCLGQQQRERVARRAAHDAELQHLFDASGKRLMVYDAHGEVLGKWRRRATQLKVYDRALHPVGVVLLPHRGAPRPLSARRMGEATALQITAVSPQLHELPGGARLEKRGEDQWLLTTREARLILRVERASNGSLLLFDTAAPGASPWRTLSTSPDATRVTISDASASWQAPVGMRAAEVLPFMLEPEVLDPLEGALLGQLLAQQMAPEPQAI